MKFILDDRKIIKFLAEKKTPITNFAREIKMTPATLNKVIDGEPVKLSTAQKISKAMGLHPHAIILASIVPKKTAQEIDPPRDKMREWYLSK